MPDAPRQDALSGLTAQLRDDVGAIVWGLTALVGPSEAMRAAEQQVQARAAVWAAQLLGDDDRLAAQTVIDLVNVLWPGDGGPPAEWWQTPLGQATARSVGYPGAEVISYSVAGAMLGCTKQYVGKLVAGGRLQRGPAGGVTTGSVRAILTGPEGRSSRGPHAG
jgi:type II secretory pathway pseudopilin PulG